jgi:hypothetical protein
VHPQSLNQVSSERVLSLVVNATVPIEKVSRDYQQNLGSIAILSTAVKVELLYQQNLNGHLPALLLP